MAHSFDDLEETLGNVPQDVAVSIRVRRVSETGPRGQVCAFNVDRTRSLAEQVQDRVERAGTEPGDFEVRFSFPRGFELPLGLARSCTEQLLFKGCAPAEPPREPNPAPALALVEQQPRGELAEIERSLELVGKLHEMFAPEEEEQEELEAEEEDDENEGEEERAQNPAPGPVMQLLGTVLASEEGKSAAMGFVMSAGDWINKDAQRREAEANRLNAEAELIRAQAEALRNGHRVSAPVGAHSSGAKVLGIRRPTPQGASRAAGDES